MIARTCVWRVRRLGVGGFTLIELLVVLAIAAVAVSVVVPLLGSAVSKAELKGAARELASALRHARGQAISNRQDVAVILDVDARRYRVSNESRVYVLPSGLDVTLSTAESEVAGESQGAIRYFPDGTSTGGRITLASGDRRYRVDVNWLTGEVAIAD